MTNSSKEPNGGSPPSTPGWVKVFGIIILIGILLFAGLWLFGGGRHGSSRHTNRPPIAAAAR